MGLQKDIPQLSSAAGPVGMSAKQNTYLHEEEINEKAKSTKKPSLKLYFICISSSSSSSLSFLEELCRF